MKTQIYTLRIVTMAILATILAACTGCESFVEVPQPTNQLTADGVFESPSTANAAVSDLYAQLRENGLLSGKPSGLSMLLGTYTDETDYYGSGTNPTTAFYANALLANNAYIGTLWDAAYNQVYAANLIYAKASVSPALGGDRDRIMGEALFIRALNHFYLASLLGDVPLALGTDYRTNGTLPRTPYPQVMEQVTADLELATTLLPEEYPTTDRARANKAVAQALLARVYLYRGMWAEAANSASAVINRQETYAFEPDMDNTFLRTSSATIWQLASAYEGHNTDEAQIFIFTAGPPTAVALTQSLLDAFEPGDLRKQNWTFNLTDGSGSWHHPFKYKQKDDTGNSLEYAIMLRLSEQYLIRAEARAIQGDIIGAREDLDAVRQQAGLPPTTAITQQDLADAILRERRVELFTEHGHRFFDLKRNGQLDTTLSTKAGWNTADAFWPIPQDELLTNPSLTQNPGY